MFCLTMAMKNGKEQQKIKRRGELGTENIKRHGGGKKEQTIKEKRKRIRKLE